MIFKEIYEDVENISNVKDQRTLVKRMVNHALNRVFCYHDFPYYLGEGVIKTINDYSTGTVSITTDSATITGSGTTWTSAMVGRKIRFNGKYPYYRIKTFTSTTELILEQPVQETTDTAATYIIYQDEYRLDADVDKYKLIRQAQNNRILLSLHPSRFDEAYPMPKSYSDPTMEIMSGTKLDTYSTGTLSGTVNTSVLTGSSTVWTGVEGLGRMSRIRVGNNVYTVKSVDSNTQITIYEILTASIAASTSYVIDLSNLVVQVYQIPNAQRLLYYRKFRLPTPLVHDYDLPDMLSAWHWLLVYGALSMIFIQKGDIQKSQNEAEQRFVAGLMDMKLKEGSFTPDRIYKRKSIDRIPNRTDRLDGLEPADFMRPYSG